MAAFDRRRDQPAGEAFEHRANLEEIGDPVRPERHDGGLAARRDGHEPVALQRRDGAAQRRAADAEALGEILLHQLLPSREFPAQDHAAQRAVAIFLK
jgi:hypothetical protein